MLNPDEVKSLLSDLCIKFGFCLPPEKEIRLRKKPPEDIDAFTDQVIFSRRTRPASIRTSSLQANSEFDFRSIPKTL